MENKKTAMTQIADFLKPMGKDKLPMENPAPEQKETLGDDYQDISPELLAKINKEEPVVRATLALVGVDYDALIRMDGVSAYSKAIQANPQVLKRVAVAQSPVLEALRIALKFKPIAEFTEKYGKTPEEMHKNITAEAQAGAVNQSAPKTEVGVLSFSGKSEEKPVTDSAKKEAEQKMNLNHIFK